MSNILKPNTLKNRWNSSKWLRTYIRDNYFHL